MESLKSRNPSRKQREISQKIDDFTTAVYHAKSANLTGVSESVKEKIQNLIAEIQKDVLHYTATASTTSSYSTRDNYPSEKRNDEIDRDQEAIDNKFSYLEK